MGQARQDYQQYISNLLIKGSIVGCILSILLIPIGAGSDFLLYGDFFEEFLYARLSCTILTSLILCFHFHKTINKFIKILTFSWLFFIQAMICVMIIISNKPDLVYHNGLILLIFAATILLPLTTKETLIICIISISTYISAVLQTDIDSVGIIYNNIFTLTLAATIGITATKLKSKLLFQHFLLNYKLNKQLIKITKTQEELIDKETSQAMTNLSSELIHEINNPLNFTITALNTLNTINQRNKNIELQEAYTDISTGISRIKNTINNLKNLSLIQKPIDKTNFNIFEAIETALKLQEEIIDNINVRILIDKNLTIHASKIHFIQIFINLIKNATQSIKSPEVKDPEITIVAQKEKDQITFSIADNGPVIKNFKTATINKLSIIQSKNNPGIDLNIAIKLIEQQNSKIKVESTKDHNRISFTI